MTPEPQQPAREKRTLLVHFYNEAYLLPWWCQNHRPMFDHAICIDYASTDGSAEIIKEMCPHWDVIPSRNPWFESQACDDELIDIEKSISGWRIVLNVTEFLLGDMDKLDRTTKKEIIAPTFAMVDPISAEMPYPSQQLPLHLQHTHGYFDLHLRSGRCIRRIDTPYPLLGRHYYNYNSDDFIILWYGYAPFNEHLIQRRLQIQNRIPQRELDRGLLRYQIMDREKLLSLYEQHASKTYDLSAMIKIYSEGNKNNVSWEDYMRPWVG